MKEKQGIKVIRLGEHVIFVGAVKGLFGHSVGIQSLLFMVELATMEAHLVAYK